MGIGQGIGDSLGDSNVKSRASTSSVRGGGEISGTLEGRERGGVLPREDLSTH